MELCNAGWDNSDVDIIHLTASTSLMKEVDLSKQSSLCSQHFDIFFLNTSNLDENSYFKISSSFIRILEMAK